MLLSGIFVHKVNLYFGFLFLIVTCGAVLVLSTLFYLGFFLVEHKVYKNINQVQKILTRFEISHIEALDDKR